jgi:hypothetical protein
MQDRISLPTVKTAAECKELLEALNSVITGAEAFMAGKIGGTALSRKVSWPARIIGEKFPELNESMTLFVGIDSQSDHLPIDVTYPMTSEFKIQVERELAGLDEFYREDVSRVCKVILDTLPAARTAIEASFEEMTSGWLPENREKI